MEDGKRKALETIALESERLLNLAKSER